ncbi:hypothetical protein ABIA48_004241 [Pseudomonas sp. S30_BP2TU TE3576]
MSRCYKILLVGNQWVLGGQCSMHDWPKTRKQALPLSCNLRGIRYKSPPVDSVRIHQTDVIKGCFQVAYKFI